jgi:hypothetical protein
MAGEIKDVQGPPVAKKGNPPSKKTLAMEADYKIQAYCDLDRVKALIMAEKDAHEDHIWALREDPSYFAEVIQEYADHSRYHMTGKDKKKHSKLNEPGAPALWNESAARLIKDEYTLLVNEDHILRLVERLRHLYRAYQHGRSDRPLHRGLFIIFQRLWCALEHAADCILESLELGWVASPALREYCFIEGREGTRRELLNEDSHLKIRKEDWRLELKARVDFNFPRKHPGERLVPGLDGLFKYEIRGTCGLHAVMDELERLTEKDREMKGLFSSWVDRRLSSLGVIADCLHQLGSFQPWGPGLKAKTSGKPDSLFPQWFNDTQYAHPFMMTKLELEDIHKLCNPSGKRFYYPVDKERTERNDKARREAEANLDAFWAAIDKYYQSKTGDGSGPVSLLARLTTVKTIQRTPKWVQPGAVEKPVKQKEYEHVPWQLELHDPTKEVTGSFDPPMTPKKKRRNSSITSISTPGSQRRSTPRGRPAVSQEAAQADAPEAEVAVNPEAQPPAAALAGPVVEPPPALRPLPENRPFERTPSPENEVFEVSRGSLRVFRTLFHNPDEPERPGAIAWRDFVRAMDEIGFPGEQLHGSAWTFRPKNPRPGIEHPIQFHEPHGRVENNLSVSRARQMGRHLNRRYGFEGKSFRRKS